jgi:hypothetical protein
MMRALDRVAVVALLVLPFAAGCTGGGDPLSPPTLGGMALTVSGLPTGSSASIQVTGPGGFNQAVGATASLDNLVPGLYSVAAAAVSTGGSTWNPAPATQTVDVPASTSRVQVGVAYGLQTGALIVSVSGLPDGTNAAITVSGAAGFSAVVAATDTLEGLVAGTYTVTATNVTQGAINYAAAPQSQQVQVVALQAATAGVSHSIFVPGSVNLLIDGMNLIQSVQSYSDTVPLVSGRDAYLRVFVRADQANAISPSVRVRLYAGSNPVPVETYTIPSPGATTPTSVAEGTLGSSWNQLIPGSLILPDLRILADVDPGNGFGESNEADNTFPVSGTAKTLVVRAANPVDIRFVPVVVQGVTGGVSAGNVAQFTVTMRKLFPLRIVNADVRSQPFTSAAAALQSSDATAWGQVLSEVNALRTADAFTGYYYGVVRTSYSSGIAGIGYVPGRTAIGWDRLPSGDDVMAHEFGHNLSLSHAPCGGVSNPDPNFPDPTGNTGVYGLDVGSLALKPPTSKDLMGYCGGTQWISAYHYLRAFNYRTNNPQASMLDAPADGLLVWGRIAGGAVVLEPAFAASAPRRPPRGNSHVVEALDAAGRILARQSFDAELVADLPGDARHFAFVLPVSAAARGQVARLRVRSAAGTSVERQGSMALRAGVSALRAPAARSVSRPAAHAVRIRWDATGWPMAVVRDANTGVILAFARGGDMTLAASGAELDVTWSDGVQSVQERVRVQ